MLLGSEKGWKDVKGSWFIVWESLLQEESSVPLKINDLLFLITSSLTWFFHQLSPASYSSASEFVFMVKICWFSYL